MTARDVSLGQTDRIAFFSAYRDLIANEWNDSRFSLIIGDD